MKIITLTAVLIAMTSLTGCSNRTGITENFQNQIESVRAADIGFCEGKGVANYMEVLDSTTAMIKCSNGKTFWVRK